MDSDGKSDKKADFYSKYEKLIIALLTFVLALITEAVNPVLSGLFTRDTEEDSGGQEFVSILSEEEVLGMTYINYEISSSPPIIGYELVPYSYICCEKEAEKEYLFLTDQFTQRQYVSDQSGVCILKREDTSRELADALRKAYIQREPDGNVSVTPGCVVAIRYYEEGEQVVELVELANGNLHRIEDKELLTAIGDSKKTEVSMLAWPGNMESVTAEFFK